MPQAREASDTPPLAETEIELKLAISPHHVTRLKRSAVLRAAKNGRRFHTRHIRSIYFDTPKLALARRGVALRLRHKGGGRWEQTIKAGPAAAVLPDRREWTVSVPEEALALDAYDGSEVAGLFKGKLRRKLDVLFETDVARSAVDVVYGDGVIELAVDLGAIRSAGGEDTVCEVELELKQGPTHALFDLALALAEEVPLVPLLASKSERGRQLWSGARRLYAKAEPTGLVTGMTADAAFRAMIGSGLAQVLGNIDCVRADAHPEGTHQMRVGLRRLRSALTLFRQMLPVAEETDTLRRLVRSTAKSLDGLRDWDVFLEETLPPVDAALGGELAGLTDLHAAAAQHRAAALKQAQVALDGPDFSRLTVLLAAWSAGRRPPVDAAVQAAMDMPVEVLAARLLRDTARRVAKTGRRLAELDPPALHRWRLKVKQLRYACDYFAELYPGKPVRRYRRRLADIQDILGKLNDAVVARERMTDLTPDLTVAGHEAAGAVAGWHACLAFERLEGLSRAWQGLAASPDFWR